MSKSIRFYILNMCSVLCQNINTSVRLLKQKMMLMDYDPLKKLEIHESILI